MNKLFTKIATAFVGIAMAIGVGVAIGSNSEFRAAKAEEETATWTATSGGLGSGIGSGTITDTKSGSWSYTRTLVSGSSYSGWTSNCIQLGKNGGVENLILTTAAYSSATIKSVSVECSSYQGKHNVSITVDKSTYLSSTSTPSWTTVDTKSGSGTSSGTITISFTGGTRALYIKSLSVTYESGGTQKIATTTTVTATGGKTTLETGKSPADTVQLIPVVKDSDQNVLSVSVSYAVTTGSAVTVSNTGLVTAVSAGNATITVTYAGGTISGKTYSSSSGTIQITVVDPFPASGEVTIETIDKIGSGTGYAAYDGSHSTSIPDSSHSLTWTSSNVMAGGSHLQFKKSNGYIYNTVDLGNITSVTPSDSNLTVFYGTSQHPTSGSSVGTGNGYFTVINNSANAVSGATVTIKWGTAVTLDSITAGLDSTAVQKTWHVNDPLTAAEVDVTPSYSDGSGTKVEDGTGVYFNAGLTETTYTFSATGNVSVPVYYQDANGRTANTTFTVNNVQPGKTVQAFSLTGSVGETIKTQSYDLSGLVLHAWYDTQMTDEAPANVVALYELIANPTTAGSSADPNNVIDVEVHLKSDHSKVHTFENVSAPITDAPKGSEDNPYTVAEAIAAIGDGSSVPAGTFYATGFIKRFGSDNTAHCIWLVDNPDTDMELPDTSCLEAYLNKSTAVPTPEGVDFDEDIYPYDKVTISGTMTLYNSQPEFTSYAITEWASESIELVLSQSEDTLIYKSPFSYSGTITADFAIWNDKVLSHSDVTFTGYDTSTVGDQTVTISYAHPIYDEPRTATYTLHVVYAEVSTVTLTEHSINVGVEDTHQFSASLNEGVDPSSVITWTVVNDVGSSIPTNEFNINSSGYFTIDTNTSGTLVVTASCSGHDDHCTVTVTGDPYVTFNKVSIKGIVGANLDSSVTATANGLAGEPTTYTWSIKAGEATDLISFTNGNASTTLTFLKAGSTVLHVVISDGSAKTAEGDIEVDVIESLNEVIGDSTTDTRELTFDFSSLAEQGTSGSGSAVSFTNDVIIVSSDKAYQKPSNNHMKVYAGGSLTITASQSFTIKTIVINQASSYVRFDSLVENVDSSSWTQQNTASAQARVTSIVVTCEKTIQGKPVNNINYNAQKAILDFADQFSTMLNSVCDQATGDTPMSGDEGLVKQWGDIQSAFAGFRNSLSTSAELGGLSEREIFDTLIANAGKNQGGDALERALSSYDYVYSKYHATLDGGVEGSADFLHNVSERDPVSYAPRILPTILAGKITNTSIIVAVTLVATAIAVGGYFFLRKKKED